MSKPHIRLELPHARAILEHLDPLPLDKELMAARLALSRAVMPLLARAARRSGKAAELPALPFPKPKPGDRKERKRGAQDEHVERMRVIRAALVARTGHGMCERCHCRPMVDPHHLFGRGRGRPMESERNCVGLCRPCHKEMQHPASPAVAVECWDWAGRHLEELGFGEEAAMAWARAKKYQTRAELSRAGEAVRAAEVSRE